MDVKPDKQTVFLAAAAREGSAGAQVCTSCSEWTVNCSSYSLSMYNWNKAVSRFRWSGNIFHWIGYLWVHPHSESRKTLLLTLVFWCGFFIESQLCRDSTLHCMRLSLDLTWVHFGWVFFESDGRFTFLATFLLLSLPPLVAWSSCHSPTFYIRSWSQVDWGRHPLDVLVGHFFCFHTWFMIYDAWFFLF